MVDFMGGPEKNDRSAGGVGRFIRIAGGFGIAFALLVAIAHPVAADIEIVDLGTLGGESSIAADISESGHITGTARTADGSFHAVLWLPDSSIVDLGAPQCCISQGFAVNSLGQVAGYSGDPTPRAYLWSDGVARDLGTLTGEGGSQALDVNDLGQVVGWSDTLDTSVTPPRPVVHAFLWSAETGMIDLGTLDGRDTKALAINNAGQVMGAVVEANFAVLGFSWTPETGMINIGDLGGGFTIPSAMNELGQITGTSATATACCHSFLWTPGIGMIDLGTLGSDLSVSGGEQSGPRGGM